MKRFIENKLYIQISDIIFLLSGEYAVPESLHEFLFTKYKVIDNSKSGNEFVCFDNPDDIEYFNNLSFITDYDIYMRVSMDILENIIENITCKKRQIELRINNIKNPSKELKEKYKIITLKATDISNIYLYRTNKINLDIPGEKYEPLLIKEIKHTIGRRKQNEKNDK